MSGPVENRIVRLDWQLPPTLTARLRKMALDNFTGRVELIMRRGKVCGFRLEETIELPQDEIR
jgi:hypothetical protein